MWHLFTYVSIICIVFYEVCLCTVVSCNQLANSLCIAQDIDKVILGLPVCDLAWKIGLVYAYAQYQKH